MRGRARARRVSLVVGLVIGAAGVAFVVRLMIQRWDAVELALASSRPLFIMLALPVGVVGMGTIGLAWLAILRRLGHVLDPVRGLRGYYVGQLGKYVPGGVWAIMGRGEWARQQGAGGVAAYSSVALSMGTAYLAGIVLVTGLAPFRLITGADVAVYTYLVMLVLPLGLVALHPRSIQAVLRLAQRFRSTAITLRPLPLLDSMTIVARQVPAWLLIGTATWMVASSFAPSAEYLDILIATSVSWVIGFLFLPVPGGIGIREAAFVATATSLDPGVAATTALTARLVFVAADALGAGLTSVAVAVRRNGGTG